LELLGYFGSFLADPDFGNIVRLLAEFQPDLKRPVLLGLRDASGFELTRRAGSGSPWVFSFRLPSSAGPGQDFSTEATFDSSGGTEA